MFNYNFCVSKLPTLKKLFYKNYIRQLKMIYIFLQLLNSRRKRKKCQQVTTIQVHPLVVFNLSFKLSFMNEHLVWRVFFLLFSSFLKCITPVDSSSPSSHSSWWLWEEKKIVISFSLRFSIARHNGHSQVHFMRFLFLHFEGEFERRRRWK